MTPSNLDTRRWLHKHKTLPLSIGLWCCLGLAGAYLPLVADEAYYLAWSHRLALGYFDHPPMVAYVIALCGHMPRLTAWLLCGASVTLLTMSAKTLELRYWHALPLLFLCTPLGVVSALITTPDTPLLFACALLIYGLVSDRKTWVCVALCFGLWSKPTALLLIPAIWFRYPKRWSALITIVAFVGYLPHLYWSIENGGLPWTFQSQRTYALGWSSLPQVLEMLGTQAVLVGPLFCISFWQLIRDRSRATNRLFLGLVLPSCFAALCLAMGMRIEGNWPMLMWPPILLLTLTYLDRSPDSPWIRFHGVFMVVTILTASGITIGQKHLPVTIGPDRDGPRLGSCLKHHFPNQQILSTRYQEAALLLLDRPNARVLKSSTTRGSQFDLWSDRLHTEAECDDIVLGLPNTCPEAEVDHEYCGQKIYECVCRHYP